MIIITFEGRSISFIRKLPFYVRILEFRWYDPEYRILGNDFVNYQLNINGTNFIRNYSDFVDGVYKAAMQELIR